MIIIGYSFSWTHSQTIASDAKDYLLACKCINNWHFPQLGLDWVEQARLENYLNSNNLSLNDLNIRSSSALHHLEALKENHMQI